MHRSVQEWVSATDWGKVVAGAHVLEVGSYDINGTIRPALAPHAASYLGVDIEAGPGVDRVVPVYRLIKEFGSDRFDIVISTEMLEHVGNWRAAMQQMAAVTRPGGWFVVTTRSAGFPYHPFPVDLWRFEVDDMDRIMNAVGCRPVDLRSDPLAPGVFCRARRVGPVGSLRHIEVGRP